MPRFARRQDRLSLGAPLPGLMNDCQRARRWRLQAGHAMYVSLSKQRLFNLDSLAFTR